MRLLGALAWALCVGGCARPEAGLPPSARGAASTSALAASTARPPIRAGLDAPPAPTPAPHQPRWHDLTRVHSPLARAQVAQLEALAQRSPERDARRFARVGDSISASGDSLSCLARRPPSVALHPEAHRALEALLSGAAPPQDPFTRVSQCAVVGWSAWQALDGARPPLLRELDATRARFALVQYGTNDMEIRALHQFAGHLWNIVEAAQARGVHPILYTIPDRADRLDRAREVPSYNAAIASVALASGAQLIDYHLALQALPRRGLARDGIHPNTYRGPRGNDGCELGPEGLRHGYNLRNLLSLEALGRARRALAGEPLDDAPTPLVEASAPGGPWTAPGLPFLVALPVTARATAPAPRTSCAEDRGSPAGSLSLRWTLETARDVQLLSFGRRVSASLTLLRDGVCLAVAQRALTRRLAPGQYTLRLDARRSGDQDGWLTLAAL